MKKISIFILLITILASCTKDANIVIKEVEKFNNYNPSNAKQEVLDFLKTTKTYNNSTSKTSTTYPDREISEAKWVMEGASNFLQNTNLDLKSNETIKYDIIVNNKTSTDGTLMMDGGDMTNKFDYIHNQVQSHTTSTGKDAKLIDYKIISADNTKSTIEVYAVYGVPGGSSATSWPTNQVTPAQVAQLYTDSINREIILTSVGNTNNGNGTINQGFWYSSVSILGNLDVVPSVFSSSNINEIGVGNLYYCSTAQVNINPNIFPNSLIDLYFHSTKAEIYNQINYYFTNLYLVTGLISCEIDWSFLTVDGRTYHKIDEIITGTKQSY